MTYKLEYVTNGNKEFADFLHTKIKEFNDANSSYHRASRKKGAINPLAIIVKDESDTWAGGISAELYWDWVEINDFWLPNVYRRKGLGSALLRQLEEIATDKGAAKSLVTTFEFQAKQFYEKQGYQITGEIKDYPPGSCFYTMVKTLF